MGARGLPPDRPQWKLAPTERRVVGWLGAMDLWSKRRIAAAYDISDRTVRKHEMTYGSEVWSRTVRFDETTIVKALERVREKEVNDDAASRRKEESGSVGPRLDRVQAVAGGWGPRALPEDKLSAG